MDKSTVQFQLEWFILLTKKKMCCAAVTEAKSATCLAHMTQNNHIFLAYNRLNMHFFNFVYSILCLLVVEF